MNCHTHFEKNVTYNIALKSTTYAIYNVTLGVTLLQRNITFVRKACHYPRTENWCKENIDYCVYIHSLEHVSDG